MDFPDTKKYVEKIVDEPADIWDLIRYAQIGRNMNNVTHEVNNLLGAVLAYSELVQMNENVSDESNRMLDEVKNAVEKSTRILGTLTTVARQEKDHQNACAVDELLVNTLELYEFELKRNRVAVDGNYTEFSHTLVINNAWLQRSIMYLISEALALVLKSPTKLIRIHVDNTPDSCALYFLPRGCDFQSTGDSVNVGMAREMAALVDAKVIIDSEKGYGLLLNG